MNPNISDGAKALLTAGAKAGGVVSGGPVHGAFVSGWGVHPFVGRVAHHWRLHLLQPVPEAVGIVSACALTTVVTDPVPLLDAGSFPHCQRCDLILLRATKARR